MSATGGYGVDPRELEAYADYVGDLATKIYGIQLDAMFEGMNSSGFTGLLTPVGTACDELRESALRPAFETLLRKLSETGESVKTAAYKYGLAEVEQQERIQNTGSGTTIHAI